MTIPLTKLTPDSNPPQYAFGFYISDEEMNSSYGRIEFYKQRGVWRIWDRTGAFMEITHFGILKNIES